MSAPIYGSHAQVQGGPGISYDGGAGGRGARLLCVLSKITACACHLPSLACIAPHMCETCGGGLRLDA